MTNRCTDRVEKSLCTWPKCECGGAHGIIEGCPVDEEAGIYCACGNDLASEKEQRDGVCRECL